jgi:hypothetical protein
LTLGISDALFAVAASKPGFRIFAASVIYGAENVLGFVVCVEFVVDFDFERPTVVFLYNTFATVTV